MSNLLYILNRYVHAIPVAMVLVLFILSIYENVKGEFVDNSIMGELQLYFGASWSTILICMAFFFYKRLQFCTFTKWNVAGLLINIILYEIGRFISNEWYQKFYTITVFTIVYGAWLFYHFRNKKQ
jgi:hypothetical protein